MSGLLHTAGGLRITGLSRELVLLGFVAAVTFTATQYLTVDWAPAPCDVPAAGTLVACTALLPVLLRRCSPVVAVLAAAALFGGYPATGAALVLASYSVAARVRRTRWRLAVAFAAALLPFTIGLIGSGYQGKAVFIEFGIAALVIVVRLFAMQTHLSQTPTADQSLGRTAMVERYCIRSDLLIGKTLFFLPGS